MKKILFILVAIAGITMTSCEPTDPSEDLNVQAIDKDNVEPPGQGGGDDETDD